MKEEHRRGWRDLKGEGCAGREWNAGICSRGKVTGEQGGGDREPAVRQANGNKIHICYKEAPFLINLLKLIFKKVQKGIFWGDFKGVTGFQRAVGFGRVRAHVFQFALFSAFCTIPSVLVSKVPQRNFIRKRMDTRSYALETTQTFFIFTLGTTQVFFLFFLENYISSLLCVFAIL